MSSGRSRMRARQIRAADGGNDDRIATVHDRGGAVRLSRSASATEVVNPVPLAHRRDTASVAGASMAAPLPARRGPPPGPPERSPSRRPDSRRRTGTARRRERPPGRHHRDPSRRHRRTRLGGAAGGRGVPAICCRGIGQRPAFRPTVSVRSHYAGPSTVDLSGRAAMSPPGAHAPCRGVRARRTPVMTRSTPRTISHAPSSPIVAPVARPV
jgi:hypothetical protein